MKIEKSKGTTTTEKFLSELCESTFLSMWSYPNVFRSTGKNSEPRELCDLMVVFGNHIILFSDKEISYPTTVDDQTNWTRWFRKAVYKSAKQLWVNQQRIHRQPENVFIDRLCKKPFPYPLPKPENAIFHLVVIANGAGDFLRNHPDNETGSLIINTDSIGKDGHAFPFAIGDLNPDKNFVHVLNEDSLKIVMKARDTISDFVHYLEKKEEFLRSGKKIFLTGEEDLLALYLKNVNDDGEHDFVFSDEEFGNKEPDCIFFTQGFWDDFQKHPQRKAQIQADKVSYFWDYLIEKFNEHAMAGTQYFKSSGGVQDSEQILRFLAAEPRYSRRYLSELLFSILESTPRDQRRVCFYQSIGTPETGFVFLLLPTSDDLDFSVEEYRTLRINMLHAACMAAKTMVPELKHFVGVATETDMTRKNRSEDACYYDAARWNDDLEQEALELRKELALFQKPREVPISISEYPELPPLPKNPRNKPCVCGSGKKYKKCCYGRL